MKELLNQVLGQLLRSKSFNKGREHQGVAVSFCTIGFDHKAKPASSMRYAAWGPEFGYREVIVNHDNAPIMAALKSAVLEQGCAPTHVLLIEDMKGEQHDGTTKYFVYELHHTQINTLKQVLEATKGELFSELIHAFKSVEPKSKMTTPVMSPALVKAVHEHEAEGQLSFGTL